MNQAQSFKKQSNFRGVEYPSCANCAHLKRIQEFEKRCAYDHGGPVFRMRPPNEREKEQNNFLTKGADDFMLCDWWVADGRSGIIIT